MYKQSTMDAIAYALDIAREYGLEVEVLSSAFSNLGASITVEEALVEALEEWDL